MSTPVTRDDLSKLQGITPKLLRALEELLVGLPALSQSVDGQISATGSIQQATVVTLSPNDAFQNEYVLSGGQGITLTITDNSVTIAASNNITTNGGYQLTFNLLADTDVDIPFSGTMATTDLGGDTYADDAAAAAGGVQIGEIYKKSGTGAPVVYRVA